MSYSEIESTIKSELIKLRPELHAKVNYPDIGEYGKNIIPQQFHDQLQNSVESDNNTDRLLQLLLLTNTKEISFLTNDTEDDVSVFILDGEEGYGKASINFALPKRFFVPLEGDKSLDYHITKLITNFYDQVLNKSIEK